MLFLPIFEPLISEEMSGLHRSLATTFDLDAAEPRPFLQYIFRNIILNITVPWINLPCSSFYASAKCFSCDSALQFSFLYYHIRKGACWSWAALSFLHLYLRVIDIYKHCLFILDRSNIITNQANPWSWFPLEKLYSLSFSRNSFFFVVPENLLPCSEGAVHNLNVYFCKNLFITVLKTLSVSPDDLFSSGFISKFWMHL